MLVVLVLAAAPPTVQANPPTDSARLDRLVDLGKLWGTVKFFHPYLAYRPVDWDSALVAAIPAVEAATDSTSFGAAVQLMLDALDDPATAVVVRESPAPPPLPVDELDSLSHCTPDSVLVVTIRRETMGDDFWSTVGRFRELESEIVRARGILFDLRSDAPRGDLGTLDYYFSAARLEAALIRAPVTTPGHRSRTHMGYVPQQGPTSGGYFSGFVLQDGTQIAPSVSGADVPVVFLVNENSDVPSVALAMQSAGRAAIVSEGPVGDAALVETHRMTLSDGIEARLRLGELVHADGTGGFAPNLQLSSADTGDAARQRCLALLRDFEVAPAPRPRLPPASARKPDSTHDDTAYPSREYRMLASFQIWVVIEYFFPYRDLMDEDWEGVLRSYLPRFMAAEDSLAYHLAVAEMYAHIRDTHGFVSSSVLSKYLGTASTPLYLRWIEDAPVVAGFYDAETAHAAGVEIGDVILEVDGDDALQRAKRLSKYFAASTPQALMSRAVGRILSGPEGHAATLKVRGRDGNTKTVDLPRSRDYRQGFTYRTGDVVRLLNESIGYADLDRLTSSQVDEMFDRFRDTDAIIFDMRGYPNGTAWTIAPYLADEPAKGAARFERPMLLGPDESGRQVVTFTQRIPEPGPQVMHYTGKTVMLIDERTISQAEHTGLFFEAANGTVFIGSHSNGANGDVTSFFVPGGIRLGFSGQAVRHADGRQLQRLGLVPDVEVDPTIEAVRAGRDEVLEAAVLYLKRTHAAD